MRHSPPLQLFYSYSQKDEDDKNDLIAHLSLLKKSGIISEWHDRNIIAGQNWSKEIDTHLGASDIILLLLSANFIASDYCYGIEMRKALERHDAGQCIVIPIFLKSFDTHNAPFENIQGLPGNNKPISSWSNRDEAWTDVAQGIRKACEDRLKEERAPSEIDLLRLHLEKGYTTQRIDPTIYHVAWSPDCNYVATGDNNQQISIWKTDLTEAEFESGEFKLANRVDILESNIHSGIVKALTWDPTGKRLASSGTDKNILIWDIDFDSEIKQKPTSRLKRHTSAVNSLIWLTPNRLISGSDDTEIMIWNPNTGDHLYQFINQNRRVTCMAISPGNNYLAVGGDDGVVRIFDWVKRQMLQELKGHTGEIYSVAWSSDGTLASASEDQEIRLWDLRKPDASQVLSGHSEEVLSISFSYDGRLLASQSSDMTLRFWDAISASPVHFREWECSVHPNAGMKFDSERPLLISLGGKDHTFRIWKVPVEDLLNSARKRTFLDNQAWKHQESGFISTSLRNSKQHQKVRDACEEAGHRSVRLQCHGRHEYSEIKALAIERASQCDFYLGVFHSPEDCLFAESEIEYFLKNGKKFYFFFPSILDESEKFSTSQIAMYNAFRDKLSKSYHVHSYENDDDLFKNVLRVLKVRLPLRRSLIQSSENGLYQ